MTTMPQTSAPANAEVEPRTLRDWLDNDEAVLVDVREGFEHASERIGGSRHHALGTLDPGEIRSLYPQRKIVFHCKTGRRAADAAERYRKSVGEEAFRLSGGIEGWKAAGLETERSESAPRLDVMRQVQITAGSLVLIGTVAGAFVTPWALVLSGFVGGGLVFAGASGWCGMAKLLARMPWNRVA